MFDTKWIQYTYDQLPYWGKFSTCLNSKYPSTISEYHDHFSVENVKFSLLSYHKSRSASVRRCTAFTAPIILSMNFCTWESLKCLLVKRVKSSPGFFEFEDYFLDCLSTSATGTSMSYFIPVVDEEKRWIPAYSSGIYAQLNEMNSTRHSNISFRYSLD